mgnify:FL=1|tara:strand:- start:138 stop:803 length:666 start_codon:yes stop_codon:yes gene_type:complete
MVSAIITAAGSGSRFGGQKQFKLLGGFPLYAYSLNLFLECSDVFEVILVIPKKKKASVNRYLNSIKTKKKIIIVDGGRTRQISVKNGISKSNKKTKLICVHDAARPFVSMCLIEDSIKSCYKNDGAIVATPNYDTIKKCYNGYVDETIDRDSIWLAQTPQVFWKEKLLKAFSHANRKKIIGTDESSIMELLGFQIAIVDGNVDNFKITTSSDWERAEKLIK